MMDERQFDRLARIAAPASRRTSFRLLGGGLLAAVLTRAGSEDAAAKCVDLGNVCKKQNGQKKKCCVGVCSNKKCKCANGQVRCFNVCIDKGDICV